MSSQYPTKTISITSGKGGVGKTTLVSNLAYKLAKENKKVLVFDADFGMANVDIFFGVRSECSIQDVIAGGKSMSEIMLPIDKNLFLISGGHGFENLQNLDSFSRRSLLDSLKVLPYKFDYLLIDTSPGISQNVLHLNAAAKTNIIVVTPDPASFADAYALIKILNQKYKLTRFSIICNFVRNHEDGFYLFKRFQDVVQKFLFVSLEFLGSVPFDSSLKSANIQKRLIMKQDSTSESAISISQIANEIQKSQYRISTGGGMELFWDSVSRASAV